MCTPVHQYAEHRDALPCVKQPIATERLYVMYDTGETVPFLSLMVQNIRDEKDFRFIAVGSAVNSLKAENCNNDGTLLERVLEKRISLKDLGVKDNIDPKEWRRENEMSEEGIHAIRDRIAPSSVIVGTASRVQEQFLRLFPEAAKLCFVDNPDYDTKAPTFETVRRVQQCADVVMCPLKYTEGLFTKEDGSKREYKVVGSPTWESWIRREEEARGRREEILKKLGLSSDTPIVAFMDAYDSNPDVDNTYTAIISPLFKKLAAALQGRGFQAVIQPHPKVAQQIVPTPDLLSVCSYVVGYNSSTVFSGCLLGKKGLYLIPKGKTFTHFSIDKGYTPAIRFAASDSVEEAFISKLEEMKKASCPDLFALEGIPRRSVEAMSRVIDQRLALILKNKS